MEHYFSPLSKRENFIAREIVDIAFKIHRLLGPGLLESVYEQCFCHELFLRAIAFSRQTAIALNYEGLEVENALKIDILVDESLIIKLKAQDLYHKVWEAQILSYLKLSQKRLGYIINFHSPIMKDGIKRYILYTL